MLSEELVQGPLSSSLLSPGRDRKPKNVFQQGTDRLFLFLLPLALPKCKSLQASRL